MKVADAVVQKYVLPIRYIRCSSDLILNGHDSVIDYRVG